MPSIIEKPVVAFLSAVVGAFCAGILGWIFLEQHVNDHIEYVVNDMVQKKKIVLPPGPPGPPGPPAPIAIVARGGGIQPVGNTTFSERLPHLSEKAVLLTTARAIAVSKSLDPTKFVTGGFKISSQVDGQTVAINQEFSRNVTQEDYAVTTSAFKLLEPGEHTFQVDLAQLDPHSNNNYTLFQVDYIAIGATAAQP